MKYVLFKLTIFILILLIFDSNTIQLHSLSQSTVEKRKKNKKGNNIKKIKEISGLIKKFDNYEKYNDKIFTLEKKLENLNISNLNTKKMPIKYRKNITTNTGKDKRRYLAFQSFNQTLFDFDKNDKIKILSSNLNAKKICPSLKESELIAKKKVKSLLHDLITTIETPLNLVNYTKFDSYQSQLKNNSVPNRKFIDYISTVEKSLQNIYNLKESKHQYKNSNSEPTDLKTTIKNAISEFFDTKSQLNNNSTKSSSIDKDFQNQAPLSYFNNTKSKIIVRKVPLEKYLGRGVKVENQNKIKTRNPLSLFDLINQNDSKKIKSDATEDEDQFKYNDESLKKILNSYHLKFFKKSLPNISRKFKEPLNILNGKSKSEYSNIKKSDTKNLILSSNQSNSLYKYNSVYELLKLNKLVNKNSVDNFPPVIKHIIFTNSDKPIPLKNQKCTIKESDAILTLDQNKRVPVRIRMTLNNLYVFLDETSKIIYKSYNLEEIKKIKKLDEFCCFRLIEKNDMTKDICGYGDECTRDKGENQFVNKWITDFKEFKEYCISKELRNKSKQELSSKTPCTEKDNEDDFDEEQIEYDKINSKNKKINNKKISLINNIEEEFKISKNKKNFKKLLSKIKYLKTDVEKKSILMKSSNKNKIKEATKKSNYENNKFENIKVQNNYKKSNRNILKLLKNVKISKEIKEKKIMDVKIITTNNCQTNNSIKKRKIKIPLKFVNNLQLNKHSNIFVTRDKFNQFNTEYYNNKISTVLIPAIKYR